MSTIDEILQRAMQLNCGDRAELVHRLLDSLDGGESELSREEWESAWTNEIQRRIDQIDDGGAKLLDRDEFEQLIRGAVARHRPAGEATLR